MKEMCEVLPIGSCPNCKGQSFIVAESSLDSFLTNKYGEIVDSQEVNYRCEGMCTQCGHIYEMCATSERFIPLTPIRKLVIENFTKDDKPKYADIENPMGVD